MTTRDSLKQKFLSTTNWADATAVSMTGDASNRRYDRLSLGKNTAILMDASPERGENVRPFIAIDEYLRQQGFSAPEIYAQDCTNGFLLIEDLGQTRFKEHVAAHPEDEKQLYRTAVDVLLQLHQCPCPDVAPYDSKKMIEVCAPVFDVYCSKTMGGLESAKRQTLESALYHLLDTYTSKPKVLVQRDYHAENLLWLPERTGAARVGLLDFQDAMIGHPAYDLMSLLQDARRDVPRSLEQEMLNYYIEHSDIDGEAFENAYRVLGLQRNFRIIGGFARLSAERGKPAYLDLMPRVWNHIELILKQPLLADFAPLFYELIPAPTETTRKALLP